MRHDILESGAGRNTASTPKFLEPRNIAPGDDTADDHADTVVAAVFEHFA